MCDCSSGGSGKEPLLIFSGRENGVIVSNFDVDVLARGETVRANVFCYLSEVVLSMGTVPVGAPLKGAPFLVSVTCSWSMKNGSSLTSYTLHSSLSCCGSLDNASGLSTTS